MTFDMEEDFENERRTLLALVDARKSMSDGSKSAINTDLQIAATRELIRAYETLKGYWSSRASLRGTQRRPRVEPLEWSKSSRKLGSPLRRC
jgi:hypothetical protein